jgi:HEAT repeat protein
MSQEDLLLDGSDDEIIDALDSMAQDGDPELRSVLLEAADHPAQRVRVYASLMLAREFHDVRALPGLHEGLYDRSRRFRQEAADAIWEIGDADPGGLIRALHFERGAVRDAIVEALDLVGWIPEEANTEVTYRISTRNWIALVSLGVAAVPGLVSALSDHDGNVRRGAVWTLGQIGDRRAVKYLVEMLDDLSGDMFGVGGRVCDAAAEALLRIGTPEAREAVARWRETQDQE